jgi:hypothetical protein
MSDMRYINRKVLEALKPMGRIDGDTQIGPGTGPAALAESGTIEAWRRECEQLRGRVTQLETQLSAAQRGGTAADENEALRIIIRHLAKIL